MNDALQYFYDAEADVLYVSKGEPRAESDSDEVEEGVIARFDPVSREVVGFTILNFLKRAGKPFSSSQVLPFTVDLRLTS